MLQKKMRLIFTILVALVLIAFVFSLVGSVFAQQIELEYPQIPGGASPPNEVRGLPNFIKYMFNFGIAIAGLVAFISFVYGGVMYVASAGNPGKLTDALGQIRASLLGLGLLLGSWLLLTTINPQLVILELSKKGAEQQGIILFAKSNPNCDTEGLKEGTEFLRVKNSRSDLTADFPQVGAIKFLNSSGEINVTIYPQKDYKPPGDPTFRSADLPLIVANTCAPDSTIKNGPVKIGSVQIVWKTAGVYLFSEKNCGGNAHLYVGDTATLGGSDDFNDKAKSLKIIPSITKVPISSRPAESEGSDLSKIPVQEFFPVITNKLGVVLFENDGFKEDGAVFLGGRVLYGQNVEAECVNLDKQSCNQNNSEEPYCKDPVMKNDSSLVSSLKIFHQYLLLNVASGGQKTKLENPPSGDGVTLFGNYEFNVQDPGSGSGEFGGGFNPFNTRAIDNQIHCGPINATTVPGSPGLATGKPFWVNGGQEIGTPVLYSGTKNESKLKCTKLLAENTWASSIRIEGDYIAVLFTNDGRAEVFESPGDLRLRDNNIGDDSARYLLVIPVQK